MPIHDWTRVRANRFHHFHQSWTVAIGNALNAGRLPNGYFALIEQKTGGPEPDVITLELTPPTGPVLGGIAVAAQPPKAQLVARTEAVGYAQKANRVTVRHPDGHVVAIIEVVSPGNKNSQHALDTFSGKAFEFLLAQVHLLIIDLFPPSRRDPHGIHQAIWDQLCDEPFTPPPGKPLTVAAYAAGSDVTAYVEPLAVGDTLPDMPVFLTADRYVLCPLETTYQTAWDQYPTPLRGPLETSSS